MEKFEYHAIVDQTPEGALSAIELMEALAKTERAKLAYLAMDQYFKTNPSVKSVQIFARQDSGCDACFRLSPGRIEFKPGHVRSNSGKLLAHEAKIQAILKLIPPFWQHSAHQRLNAQTIQSTEGFLALLMTPEQAASWEAIRLEKCSNPALGNKRPSPSL